MGFLRGDSDQLSQKNCQIELLDKIYVFGGIKMDAAAKQKKKKFKLKMPGAFTILFFLTVISVMLTWCVPAGSYSKLQYTGGHLQETTSLGQKKNLPATQATLDKLHVKIDIKQFTSGAISKPVSIPNAYKRLKQHPAKLYTHG